MFVAHVQLLGSDIEDAFIYRTVLYCWTYRKTLRIYQVADLESALAATAGGEGLAAAYCLFHHRGIGSSGEQSAAYRAIRNTPGTTIPIDPESVPYIEVDIQAESGSVLDMLIYYDRMFLAADGGLFQIDDLEGLTLGQSQVKARQRVRSTCYSASSGLGAVGASCGDKGLTVLMSVFDDGADGSASRAKVADVSIASQIGYGTVVNHLSRPEVELLACETRGDPIRGNVISHVKRQRSRERFSVADSPDLSGGNTRRSDLLFWDRGRLLSLGGGDIASISVVRRGHDRRVNRLRHVTEIPGDARVISASRSDGCLVIEMTDKIVLTSSGYEEDLRIVEAGPVVAMRTFPNSVRYRKLTAYTNDDGLSLLGVTRSERPDGEWLNY